MDIISWILVLSIHGESPLPDDLAKHKEFKTYEQCYTYRDALRKLMKAPNAGWEPKTAHYNGVRGSCIPVSRKSGIYETE